MYVLLAAALAPAIVLMWYVYSRDKVEREPAGLVARVFFLGAVSGLVAGFIEGILIGLLEATVPEGLLFIVIEYFICVAAVEEACKYFCLNTVKNRPEFDYLYDAVVYSVAAALGFAALENIFYVFDGGLETALVRAVLSVPGHAADGVVMGVFYGMARYCELRGEKEKANVQYWLAFLLPTIEHGFYDAALSLESDSMAIIAIAVDLAFIALAFTLVKRTVAKDEPLRPRMFGGPSTQPWPPMPSPRQAQVRSTVQPLQQARPDAPYSNPVASSQAVSQQGSGHAPSPSDYSSTVLASPNSSWPCPQCGMSNTGNFCPHCGAPRPQ